MFLPGARHLDHLRDFFIANELWRVRPLPQRATGLGTANHPPDAQAGTRDFSIFYTSNDPEIILSVEELPRLPLMDWFNPRTGSRVPAVTVVSGRTCQVPTPDDGDWVLTVRSGNPSR